MNRKNELEKPNLKREELFSIYLDLLKQRFPQHQINFHPPDRIVIEAPDNKPVTLYPENLWLQCRNASEPRMDIMERYLRGVASMMDPKPPLAAENIVPIVKDHGYLSFPSDNPPLICEHLATDLWIVYAFDLPDLTTSVTAEQLQKLNVPRDGLHALALENLRRILPEVQQHGDGPLYLLSAGGDYTASLLLLDELWPQVEESVDGDIVAAAPSRDVVLFTGSRMREGIQAIRHKARQIVEGGDHVVSQTLLRRTEGKWKLFE